MGKFTFPKSNRLCSKKLINELFRKGDVVFVYPVRAVVMRHPDVDASVQVLISVPKKRHKTAARRNRIKRLLREAYRQEQNIMTSANDTDGLLVAFTYIANEVHSFHTVKNAVHRILTRIR